jgi:hypothetical protein
MPRIGQFIYAVAKHWGVLVTGGTIIGLLGIWQGMGHLLRPWVYGIVAIVALLLAFFKAWNDQVDEKERALAEIKILKNPVTQERKRIFQQNMEKLNPECREVLYQLVVSGQLLPQQAAAIVEKYPHRHPTFVVSSAVLSHIEAETGFIKGTFHGHYEMNPEIKGLLELWAQTYQSG